MSDFRALADGVLASPQLSLADVEAARALGVETIVNNRPEGEAEDQIPGPAIEAAARAAGMTYVAIPISQGNFGGTEVRAMVAALDHAKGQVLAYCRTGTRSTLLWALAEAARGTPIDTIVPAAAAAGYDVSPVLPGMTALAARANR